MSDAAALVLGPPAADPAALAPSPAAGENPFAWAGELSAEPPAAGKPSDRDWLANKGYRSPVDLIAAARALEGHVGGRLALPKDENDAAGYDAIFKAIGRPDTPDGYGLMAPDGASEADAAPIGAFTKKAHELGLSVKQAAGLNEWFDTLTTELTAGAQRDMVADQTAAEQAMRAELGGGYEPALELARRAATRFGLDKDFLNAMSQTIGTKAMLEKVITIGKQMGEDGLPGSGSGKFGAATPEAAAAEKKTLMADPEFVKRLNAGDPPAKAKWQSIIDIEAAELARQRGA